MQLLLLFQDAPYQLSSKDFIAFFGGLFGLISAILVLVMNRRYKLSDDKKGDFKSAYSENRQETLNIIREYKEQLEEAQARFDELDNKYTQMQLDRINTQTELAVIAFEHELLFLKLSPEDASRIKKRVDIFKIGIQSAGNAKKKEIQKESDDRQQEGK